MADIFSITPTHYLAVGVCGVTHFQALLNLLVTNVNLATLEEINLAWAVMRHKGGSKPQHLTKSWRCISTCPLVAKAMDLYVFGLHKEECEAVATPTQFMRDGSSHELCALALPEAISHSTKNLKLPIVHVYLDKESAFDSALKEHIVSAAFSASNHTPSQSILYLAHWLSCRKTFLKHNAMVIGPILDGREVEQGGISSSKLFQLTTDNELCTLNSTGLGVLSLWLPLNRLMMKFCCPTPTHATQSLINTTVELATQMNYRNVPSKTKVLLTKPKPSKHPEAKPISPSTQFAVDGVSVPVSSEATHLGIVRSGHHSSNLPALLSQIAAHSRSLYGVLNLSMAKNHRTPPSTSMRIESVFFSPVLFSGLSPLIFTKPEINTLNVYTSKVLRQLMKLQHAVAMLTIHFLS